MFYQMNLAIAPYEAESLETVSQGKGNTSLISAYNSSSVGLTERWTLNAGIYGQFLTLNNKWSVEPPYWFEMASYSGKQLLHWLMVCTVAWRKWTSIL